MKILTGESGHRPTKNRMEMWPRYLYSGGGLRIDVNGKTTLDGLYAAGGAIAATPGPGEAGGRRVWVYNRRR